MADAAVAVFHRAEAWLVLGDLLPGFSPSQSDRRMEVLQVFGVARVDGVLLQKVSLREIGRDSTGGVSGLRPLPLPELDVSRFGDMGLSGRMTELLDEEPPSFMERRRVRDVLDWVGNRLAVARRLSLVLCSGGQVGAEPPADALNGVGSRKRYL